MALPFDQTGDVEADPSSPADGAPTKLNLRSGVVVEAKIGTGAVTAGKIGTDAVTNSKIQNGAVDSNKLATDAVSTAKIQDGAVDSNKLASNAVTTAKVGNNEITLAKLADMVTQRILGRNTAGTGDPEELTPTQVTAMLDVMVGDSGSGGTKGLVKAPAAGDAAAGKFYRSDNTWAVPAGVADTTIWMPRVPPASSHAKSDFFRGADPGWTEWDVEGSFTWSRDTSRYWGLMTHTGDGATRWAGVHQAVPASEFQVICEIAMFGHALSYANVGLLIAGDIVGNPSTAAFRAGYAQVSRDSSTPALSATVASWSNHTGSPSQIIGSSGIPARFLRFRCSGSTTFFDVSINGDDWISLDTTTGTVVGFTPAYFGLVGQVTVSGGSFQAKILQVKVLTGSGSADIDYDDRRPLGAEVNIDRT